MGDRIVVMNAGRVEQIDTPLAVYDRPRTLFVAAFIGSPSMNFVEGTIAARGTARGAGRVFVSPDDPAVEFPLTAAQLEPLAAYEGRRVVAGVRPEDLHPVAPDDATPAGEAVRVRAQLDVVEPLGNEVLLYARTDRHDLTSRVSPRPLPAPGSPIELAVSPGRVHYFDAESQQVIVSAGQGESSRRASVHRE